MTESERKHWQYLVAAVQNTDGAYINAKSKRYAAAIVAADKALKTNYSNSLHTVVKNKGEH